MTRGFGRMGESGDLVAIVLALIEKSAKETPFSVPDSAPNGLPVD